MMMDFVLFLLRNQQPQISEECCASLSTTYYLFEFLSLFDAIYADTGELYSFGCNDEGQLGCDSVSEERIDVPTKITLPTEETCIKMLSAGVYHSAYLTGQLLLC